MRYTKLVAVVVLIAIATVLASACGGGSSASPEPTSPTTNSSEISKPKPAVVLVNATTAGVFDNYYAILNITAKNDGADGVVIVVGSITQGAETKKNEMPVYLPQGATQTVKLVFPLKWRGGDWTPTVGTEVP